MGKFRSPVFDVWKIRSSYKKQELLHLLIKKATQLFFKPLHWPIILLLLYEHINLVFF